MFIINVFIFTSLAFMQEAIIILNCSNVCFIKLSNVFRMVQIFNCFFCLVPVVERLLNSNAG